MLSRTAGLRDRKRIVFLFNTNHLASIDTAIARLGRFDIVRCVLPPTPAERKKILEMLAGKADLPAFARDELASDALVDATESFGFSDLNDLVRRICVRTRVDTKPFE